MVVVCSVLSMWCDVGVSGMEVLGIMIVLVLVSVLR